MILKPHAAVLALAVSPLLTWTSAHAQATVKPDGQWRAALGIGASHASGNTQSTTLSLTADAVKATDADKISLRGAAQYARSNGSTTADQFRLGGRYDRNFNRDWFGYGGLDLERNQQANLKLRTQVSAGAGYHLIRTDATTFDLFGGLAYTQDNYRAPALIQGVTRTGYNYASLMLGEESTHRLSETTSFKQRLSVIPSLKDRGEFRANWDAGLAVAINKTMNLTVGFSVAHNSDPGAGRKKTDSLLTTGVSVKFD